MATSVYSRHLGAGGFRGVDVTSSPAFADRSRFTYLRNMYRDYKGGMGECVETFPGIRRLFDFYEYSGSDPDAAVRVPINGMTRYRLASPITYGTSDKPKTMAAGDYLVVHAGHMLYFIPESRISEITEPQKVCAYYTNHPSYNASDYIGKQISDGEYYTAVFCSRKTSEDVYLNSIQSEKSLMWQDKQRLYFLCDGVMLMINPSYTDELLSGWALKIQWVDGYIPTTYIDGKQYEQRNMLTDWVKEQHTLPATIPDDGKYTITLNNRDNSNPGDYSRLTIDGIYFPFERLDADGNVINYGSTTSVVLDFSGKDYSQYAGKTVEITIPSVSAKFCRYDGKQSIGEAYPDMSEDARSAVTGCTVVTMYDDRIFYTGNPLFPNTVFWSHRDLSGYNNPAYVGVLDYVNCGSGNTLNTAMIALQNTLAVLKSDTVQDSVIYYLSGADGPDDLMPRIYTVSSGLPGVGCVGAACNFLDDAVFLSREGLLGIDRQSINLERSIGRRSSYADGALTHEDMSGAVMAEWEGYLCILFKNGHVWLADSRQMSTNGYEFYFIDGMGAYRGGYTRYRYAALPSGYDPKAGIPLAGGYAAYENTKHIGEELTKEQADGVCRGTTTAGYEILTDSSGHLIETDGEKIGCDFVPANSIWSNGSTLLFGTSDGGLLCVNTDKRGIVDGEKVESNGIDSVWYTYDGTRIESECITAYDDAGIPHLAKSTVTRSTVFDMKTMIGGAASFAVYTAKDGWSDLRTDSNSDAGFSRLDFGTLSFAGDIHTVVTARERTRKWSRKMYRITDGGFRHPFGICQISYQCTVAGRIKQ